jgi:uncharacterized protein involved in exopolysaccharide biosynthesis
MRTILFAIIPLLALTLTVSSASAEESTLRTNTSNKTAKPTENIQDKMRAQELRIASKANDLKARQDKLASRAGDKREELASRAAQMREDRCKMLNEKNTLILTRYETNKLRHITEYQNVKKKVETLVARLKTEGKDTTKLEADLRQLDVLIKKATDDYTAFMTALKDTKNYTCGRSEGAYADALKKAMDKLMIARQSLLAIRTYYQVTIRPDILALKGTRPASSASPIGETTNTQ